MKVTQNHKRIVEQPVIQAIENAIQHTVTEVHEPKVKIELADNFWVKTPQKLHYLVFLFRYTEHDEDSWGVYCVPEGAPLNSNMAKNAEVQLKKMTIDA